MDRRERSNDYETALLAALQGLQASMWTALPCIIDSFDAAKQTCSARPAIQVRRQLQDGSFEWITLSVLVDVPVVFPGGGGYTLTFPVGPGDEALVVFSSRCIDAWYQSGQVGVQAELRMHDPSDGFAFVGVKSQPRALSGVNTEATQLRSDDGGTHVEVNNGTIKLKAPTSVTIDAPLTTCTGDLVVEGDLLVMLTATITGLFSYLAGLAGFGGTGGSVITGTLTQTGGTLSSEGTVLHTHTHSGVDPGIGNSGPPT